MADEPVCIETPTKFARYTVAEGTGIALNTFLQLSGDNTASAHSGDGQVFAGIAWEEKTASDGVTEIVAALNGVWDVTDGGDTATLGALLALDATANETRPAVAGDILTGSVVGKVLEAQGANEVCRVRVGSLI